MCPTALITSQLTLKRKRAPVGSSETTIGVFRASAAERTFSGTNYLYQYSLPNFYFHLATTYGILRHNGVEVGKGDFLGSFG